MKVRSGFVSNSSTSSYVILGISNPSESVLEKFQELYDAWNEGETQTHYYHDDDGRFVGIALGCASEGDTVEVSLGKIAEMSTGLANLLGVEVDELKIIGTEVYG